MKEQKNIKPTKVIAIVANTTWNIYNFRLNVLTKLLDEGFKIYVIAPIDKYIHYKENFRSVVHIPLKHLSRDSVNPVKDIFLTLELRSIYKRIKPDIILHYTVKPNIFGAIAARLNNIPSIVVVTGLGYAFIHNGFIKTVTKILYKYTSRFQKRIIFENIDDRELFIEKGIIPKELGISIKGCGVNSDFFKPVDKTKNRAKTVFTFIGRLLYDKGVQEFVQAARIMKENYNGQTEFWLVGEIDDENPATVSSDDIMSWVREKTVVYHGATDDVRPYVSESDCIVLPSYREGLPRSIIEGMSMKKPVISTQTAGCREAIEEGKNGYLVPIKNSQALADSMERFLKLPEEKRNELGEYGRKKVESEFDDRIIANDILNIINQALSD